MTPKLLKKCLQKFIYMYPHGLQQQTVKIIKSSFFKMIGWQTSPSSGWTAPVHEIRRYKFTNKSSATCAKIKCTSGSFCYITIRQVKRHVFVLVLHLYLLLVLSVLLGLLHTLHTRPVFCLDGLLLLLHVRALRLNPSPVQREETHINTVITKGKEIWSKEQITIIQGQI